MARQANPGIQNKFIRGLVTEYTGLNFPEDAATEAWNCVFERKGIVQRRLGFDYELNRTLTTIDRDDVALSTFKWDNAGGDGLVEVLALQVGATLHFFRSSTAVTTDPLSDQKLASTITLSDYIPSGGSFDATHECTYASGNGYLFVFHPSMEPIYCTYTSGTIAAKAITIEIRDLVGVLDNLDDTSRPASLSDAHSYNIRNQGWTSSPEWTASSTTLASTSTGTPREFIVATGLSISAAQAFTGVGFVSGIGNVLVSGTVNSYNSGTGELSLNFTSSTLNGSASAFWNFSSDSADNISAFNTAAGGYPSNADVWWRYKDSTGVFDPSTTFADVGNLSSPAPKGHYILEAFRQLRSAVSGVANITDVTTLKRPRVGVWFQGRIWYAGVDASFSASGTSEDVPWSESIYFSQIIEKVGQLGRCYQAADPTSEDIFDPVPSDGGVIRIQGAGKIYKLFPVQNGLIVFAANGVWFITGSQGIGFTAIDYTVVFVGGVQSSNQTSFVNVHGWPFFWNDEGIYTIAPAKEGEGSLVVENIAKKTILSFYQEIPLKSKQYARGDYDPINMIIQWCYRSTNESSTTTRYEFDRILCLNLQTGAFYPYSISGTPKIHDIVYIQSPGGSTAPDPVFKYLTSATNGAGSYNFTFSEERDTSYTDWDVFGTAVNYDSYFITGFAIHGGAIRRFQQNYLFIYSGATVNSQYDIQMIWDFANNDDSHRFSTIQRGYITASHYEYKAHRFKMRGSGLAGQIKVSSVDGQPFYIIGWGSYETSTSQP